MKHLSITAIAVIVSMGPALAFDGFPQGSMASLDKAELALSLRDYGMWRQEHDRNTFPVDMPKAGEPYDPVTGNAIRQREIRLRQDEITRILFENIQR